MRKCPNCHKAVPDGARRCVYCRSIVEVARVEDDSEADVASHTSIGITSRAVRESDGLNPLPSNLVVPVKVDEEQDSNNQTLLGVRGLNRGASPRIDSSGLTLGSSTGVHSTMLGMPGVESTFAPKVASQDNDDDDDPLAGFAGVAQKNTVSSLIDEEFDDLSHQVLGISFQEGELDEVDNDWFDFDPLSTPAAVPSRQAQPARVSVQTDKVDGPVKSQQPQALDTAVEPSCFEIKQEISKPEPQIKIETPVSAKIESQTLSKDDSLDNPISLADVEPLSDSMVATTAESQSSFRAKAVTTKTGASNNKIAEILSLVGALGLAACFVVPSDQKILFDYLEYARPWDYAFIGLTVLSLVMAVWNFIAKSPALVKALVALVLCLVTVGVIVGSAWALLKPQGWILYASAGLFLVSSLLFALRKT